MASVQEFVAIMGKAMAIKYSTSYLLAEGESQGGQKFADGDSQLDKSLLMDKSYENLNWGSSASVTCLIWCSRLNAFRTDSPKDALNQTSQS
ncbi:hypothetical protein CDAR_392201, partial [Caerostris darwini]